jgi:hypothetical protein
VELIESKMAKEVLQHKITVGRKDDRDPVPATEENVVDDARERFGPTTPNSFAESLPDLRVASSP